MLLSSLILRGGVLPVGTRESLWVWCHVGDPCSWPPGSFPVQMETFSMQMECTHLKCFGKATSPTTKTGLYSKMQLNSATMMMVPQSRASLINLRNCVNLVWCERACWIVPHISLRTDLTKTIRETKRGGIKRKHLGEMQKTILTGSLTLHRSFFQVDDSHT